MAGNFSLPYPRSVGEGSIRALPFERLARAHSVEERAGISYGRIKGYRGIYIKSCDKIRHFTTALLFINETNNLYFVFCIVIRIC